MNSLDNLQEKIKDKDKLVLVIDYDSDITPLRPELNPPLLNSIFKRILENFAKKEYINIVLITNKKIDEFKKDFAINTENIKLCGNYGAEIEFNKERKSDIDTNVVKKMTSIFSKLKKNLTDYAKLGIKNEKYLIRLELKSVDKTLISEIKTTTKNVIKNIKDFDIKLIEKKQYFEIMPSSISKIGILNRVITKFEGNKICYIGDDEKLISEAKKQKITAIGIRPLSQTSMKLSDFTITQNELEEFLIDTNNLYL
ncbi:MAG: trehalose-phosphatase [Candidatus Gastranaerophilales bacterium]|nr:trehalose-phosphatase [Candidatus Gastranaerophilales bacterium]